jgi:hypothetical protein
MIRGEGFEQKHLGQTAASRCEISNDVSETHTIRTFRVATESVPEKLNNFLTLTLLSTLEDFIVS